MLNCARDGRGDDACNAARTTGASLRLLQGMVRKKWIVRETVAESRDARRTVRYAVLVEVARLPKLNENQQTILATLAGADGQLPVAELRRLEVRRPLWAPW